MTPRRRKMTTIRLGQESADRTRRAPGAKSRSKAVRGALDEALHLEHFKRWMTKYGGKLRVEGYVD